MRITRGNLSTIIREILSESSDDWMEDRHREDQEDQDYLLAVTIEDIVGSNPGISGMDLVAAVSQQPGLPSPAMGMGKVSRVIFDMADEMMEDGTLFFDEEEDAWFTSQEDLLAYREGGTWSDQQDYDEGFRR